MSEDHGDTKKKRGTKTRILLKSVRRTTFNNLRPYERIYKIGYVKLIKIGGPESLNSPPTIMQKVLFFFCSVFLFSLKKGDEKKRLVFFYIFYNVKYLTDGYYIWSDKTVKLFLLG